jgi:hypothetical protein
LMLAIPAAAQDFDRDGLSDQLEQSLLERFVPTLLLAHGECAGAPASFEPFAREPRVTARDGTIYGQAFRIGSRRDAVEIELHFFHLWSKDCGRLGHDLDAEHVSAIVSAPNMDDPPASWTASAWYAAAHEGSACDASSGAAARVLDAEVSGPRVFVSRGKHASYFDRRQCKWGCGGDECADDQEITPTVIVNIGEIDAPLNGATWVRSRRWPMRAKFGSDFSPGLRARFDADDHDSVIPLMQRWRAPQAPVLAGDTAVDGLATAATSTNGAVSTGAASTKDALATATRAVSRFLRRK